MVNQGGYDMGLIATGKWRPHKNRLNKLIDEHCWEVFGIDTTQKKAARKRVLVCNENTMRLIIGLKKICQEEYRNQFKRDMSPKADMLPYTLPSPMRIPQRIMVSQSTATKVVTRKGWDHTMEFSKVFREDEFQALVYSLGEAGLSYQLDEGKNEKGHEMLKVSFHIPEHLRQGKTLGIRYRAEWATRHRAAVYFDGGEMLRTSMDLIIAGECDVYEAQPRARRSDVANYPKLMIGKFWLSDWYLVGDEDT